MSASIPEFRFRAFTSKDGLASDSVNSVFQDSNGFIWACTASGLDSFDGKAFLHPLGGVRVYCLAEDQDGMLWAGTDDGLYCRYVSDYAMPFKKCNVDPASPDICSLVCGPAGEIWLAADGKIVRYDKKSGRTTDYNVPAERLFIDSKSIVWAATGSQSEPLYCFDGSQFRQPEINYVDCTRTVVTAFCEDPAGNLWFCTRDKGMCLYDRIFYSVSPMPDCREAKLGCADSLSPSAFLAGSDEGLFYMSSVDTTACLSPDMAVSSILVDDGGSVWSGTGNDGLNYSAPDSLLSALAGPRELGRPSAVITSLRASDSRNPGSVPSEQSLENLVLPCWQNDVVISFTVLDYTSSGLTGCQYRLEGVDDEWIPSGDRMAAAYKGLKAGHYSFLVRADGDGRQAELNFVVKRPLFRSVAAIAVYCLLLLTAIVLLLAGKKKKTEPEPLDIQPERVKKVEKTAPQPVPEPELPKEPVEEEAPVVEYVPSSILVVEDDADVRRSFMSDFSSGSRVVFARNNSEAMSILSGREVSLVFCELSQPGIDGIAMCEKLRSDQKTCAIPFIMMAPKNVDTAPVDAMTCSPDALIRVPYSAECLRPLVRHLEGMQSIFARRYAKMPAVSYASDRDLYVKMCDIIDANVPNANLSVESLCNELGISRSGLFAKIKAVSGTTPNNIIQDARLKAAASLLSEGRFSIGDISYIVGFCSPSYFTKCFTKQFGVGPREWVDRDRS